MLEAIDIPFCNINNFSEAIKPNLDHGRKHIWHHIVLNYGLLVRE